MKGDLDDYSHEYAEIYDLITTHKDYQSEAKLLHHMIKNHVGNINPSVLSVGCGTGSHELILDNSGFNMSCLDTSSAMIKVASKKKFQRSTFSNETIIDYALEHRAEFDVALSLFNVVNCLPDIRSLVKFFRSVALTIRPGGMFFFECWNMMPCICNPPKVVERKFSDADARYNLTRIANPSLNRMKQQLTIAYECFGKLREEDVRINSVHNLTLFTHLELEYALQNSGFKEIVFGPALAEMHQTIPDISDLRMLSIKCYLGNDTPKI